MQVYDFSRQKLIGNFTVVVVLWVTMQVAATVGQVVAAYAATHQTMDSIKNRISLDLQYLDVGNTALKTPPNRPSLQRYITRINQELQRSQANVRVSSIQAVAAPTSLDVETFSDFQQVNLITAEQTVQVDFITQPWAYTLAPSGFAFLCAIGLTPMFISAYTRRRTSTASNTVNLAPNTVSLTPKLVIHLANKTLGNGVNNHTVQMQNKPLCFYTALLRYCIANPSAQLFHHQDIPNELTQGANKVFIRLMELGHTKRKKPNFNANLDKTLSEIRAALDEVFTGFAEEKARYYPPRAQGEGSRSKQHSYALPVLSAEDIEVIGD